MMLYQFEHLRQKLLELGFPEVNAKSGYRVIRTDFKKAYQEGRIEFRDDGIYLINDGHEYRGYMFIDLYYVSYNGGPEKFPRFHLVKCETIRSFIESGRFNQRYIWSNSETNDVTDKQSKKLYENEVLQLCSYCRKEISNQIDDTIDFFEDLDTSVLTEEVQVDINGYPKGWSRISRSYKEKSGCKCESCLIEPLDTIHKRWWHVHHIDGDKTNISKTNLSCLCIICHAFNDRRHEDNFSTKRMKFELESFYKAYKEELKKLRNPYLTKIKSFLRNES
jgi:hypothetical protein